MNCNREPSVLKLIETLEDYSYSDQILCGHQNAGHIGVKIAKRDGSTSDIKEMTGSQPSIVGIDTLSFNGYEGKFNDAVKIVKNLHKQGVIITLSSHMPNFSLGGPNDYYDYSPNNVSGDVGHRILPGGDLNDKYLRFLDRIVEFVDECVDIEGEHIPMIFRPFHEDNGDWFWWGRPHLNDEDYITLFRYTIGYLVNIKGVKSLCFAYSPNGAIASKKEYMSRYPGDDVVDIMGLDLYHDRPNKNKLFYKQLAQSLDVVFDCAMERGKIPALTETGLRWLDSAPDGNYYEGLATEKNDCLTWFTDVLNVLLQSEGGARIAYVLFWANFSDTQFWVPYKGHEMEENFVEFATSKTIKLAPVVRVEEEN